MRVIGEWVLTMTRKAKSVLSHTMLLLGAAAIAFPASLVMGARPAGARDWSAQVSAYPPPMPESGRRPTQRAAARAESRAKGRSQSRKGDTPSPAAEAIPAAPAEDTAASAASTAAPAIPEASDATAVIDPPSDLVLDVMNADEGAEPDDPFADVLIVQRAGPGVVMTTRIVPGKPAYPPTAVTATVDPATTAAPTPAPAPAEGSAAAQYCTNIADAAIDARITWQRQNLAEAEKELAKRTVELETRIGEYQRWLARRDQFADKAKKVVVDIYTKMKPDIAAAQLQNLDEETAAAVLIKLDTRAASAVMNEMDATQAARLTAIISGAAKLPPKPRAPGGQGNRS